MTSNALSAGDADGCGLVGEDPGQAAQNLDVVGHELIEVICQGLAGDLRHRVFRGVAEPFVDRYRRRG
jgi:hypothetical protein